MFAHEPEEIKVLREIVLRKPKQHVQTITTTGKRMLAEDNIHPLGPMKLLQSGMTGTAEFKGKLPNKSSAHDTDKEIYGYLPAMSYFQFSKEFEQFQKQWAPYSKMHQIIERELDMKLFGRPYRVR